MLNLPEVLSGICAVDFGGDGPRLLRLFDVEPALLDALRAEAEALRAERQGSDVRSAEHVTNWTRPFGSVRQWSLWTRGGDYADTSSDHDRDAAGRQAPEPERFPALAALAAALPDAANLRLAELGPGAGLSPHKENATFRTDAGAGVCARFHLPLLTNPQAELGLGDEGYHLEVGGLYFVHHGCVHFALNRGRTPRLHLVWDQLLTRRAFAAMFGDGPAPLPGLRRRQASSWQVRPQHRRSVFSAAVLPTELPDLGEALRLLDFVPAP